MKKGEINDHVGQYANQYVTELKKYGKNYWESLAKKYIPWIYDEYHIKTIYAHNYKSSYNIDIYLIKSSIPKNFNGETISRNRISVIELNDLRKTADKVLTLHDIPYEHMNLRYAEIKAKKIINKIFDSFLISNTFNH